MASSTVIKIVVPFSPGGVADLVARQIGQFLSTKLKQPFIIENRPGAGGSIGATEVANSDPDEVVLLVASVAVITNNIGTTDIKYDESKLIPVINFGRTPTVLVTSNQYPVKNIQQWRRIDPTTPIMAGSAGTMTLSHLSLENLKKSTKKNIVHVPYKGQSAVIPDLINGNVNMAVLFYPVALPYIKSGQLNAIAIDSPNRSTELPNVPTFAEAGFPELFQHSWTMLLSNQTNNNQELEKIRQTLVESLTDTTQSQTLRSAGIIINKKDILPSPNFLHNEKTKLTPLIMQVDQK